MQITTLIFDWGDTVMRDFSEFAVPMASWPRVEAVPGIAPTLALLKGRYRVALASNAEESGADEVRRALRRVGLDDYFERIFTARDLGASKQDPAYYRQVLQALGVSAGQALMVGDGYAGDVLGAKYAGLRAAWYNPQGRVCPAPHPLHDIELDSLEQLPAALEKPLLPDVQTCLDLLRAQQADERLLAHVRAAAAAAYGTASALRRRGVPVDPLLAHRGGLLQDLDKAVHRPQGRAHGELAAELLSGMGQPALAEIARRHVITHLLDEESAPRSWEEKLVYYADKLVEGAECVGVEARLEALAQRYPGYAQEIRSSLPHVLEIEAEICAVLGMERDEYYEQVSGWVHRGG
jgi:FMN phosphatase YigB (HAD superfamily)/HD superfamily phosphodiesterase